MIQSILNIANMVHKVAAYTPLIIKHVAFPRLVFVSTRIAVLVFAGLIGLLIDIQV